MVRVKASARVRVSVNLRLSVSLGLKLHHLVVIPGYSTSGLSHHNRYNAYEARLVYPNLNTHTSMEL